VNHTIAVSCRRGRKWFRDPLTTAGVGVLN
jgi:hypothetical protein